MKTLTEIIKKEEGFLVSSDTLNHRHLLTAYYDLLNHYEIGSELRDRIKELFLSKIDESDFEPTYYAQYRGEIDLKDNQYEKECEVLINITDFFNGIAPDGYYFGASAGDGSLFGWWAVEKCEVF